MNKKGIWTFRPIEEYKEKTGKMPVSMRWVDTNEGDQSRIEIRSRMAARDFKGGDKDRDDLFAETPPLEAKRMLMGVEYLWG
jgi:hypothetical protein